MRSASPAVAGLVLAATTAWWLVAVGALAIVAAWFYTGGTKPYGYLGPRRGHRVRVLRPGRGARHDVRPDRELSAAGAWCAAVGVGALACAILVANNLRDIPTDTVAGKRTLAVVLGDDRTRVPLRAAGRPRRCVALRRRRAVAPACCALLGLVFAAAGGPARPGSCSAPAPVGPDLIPVLQRTGVAELLYAAGIFAGIAVSVAIASV